MRVTIELILIIALFLMGLELGYEEGIKSPSHASAADAALLPPATLLPPLELRPAQAHQWQV